MARRPLPRILSTGSTQIARSRELARTAADSATDVLHPLITITRGLRRLASAGRRRWTETPKDKRGPLLFLVASVVLVVALVPYGPLLAVITLMAAAAWHGRDRTPPAPEGPDESQTERLQALYEALVPYFSAAEDPAPLYTHGGDWEKGLSGFEFDDSGRISHLVVRYPAYFTDGEPAARTRIEQLLTAKSGRGREYHFLWDEEGNQLTVSVLAPLPTDIAAQRFVTSPGETVLGFTDPGEVPRTLPLTHGEERRDVPPVVWRTGIRSTEPHLLAVGQPGSGTSTLVRSIALQALQHGDVLIVEGGSTGEYACLTGREGVLAVECGASGALAALEWAAHETERRLIELNRARQAGQPPPEDTRRPLWILLDRPGALGHVPAEGRPDPLSLLQLPLRHGRAAQVTVVVAEQFDHLDLLGDAVRQHTRARVVLGPATAEQLRSVLGAPPHTTPVPQVPPGRGYARLGTGPVLRLQVPATPDPYDDATSDAHRQAVLGLLPPRPQDEDAVPEQVDPLPEQVPVEALPEPVDGQPEPVDVLPERADVRPEPAAVPGTPAGKIPVLPVEKVPVESVPVAMVSLAGASADDAPFEKVPVTKVPVEKVPIGEAAVNKVPTEAMAAES
ncbi:hypothetical protein [Streptomyces sp. NPDC005017]|uniref:hypothetical protein n=1 Tax=Streptomyces sp. NPDC005017 TaxID=3364706 RepID=UPI0036971184